MTVRGPVAVVLGTRPEAIKLFEIVERLGDDAWVIHTGQHYDESVGRAVLDGVGLRVDTTLTIGGHDRGTQIGLGLTRLTELFAARRPSVVVVQGDTNSVAAGALAANAAGIPLVHVEAGLRSFDREMPEEHNRILADHLADLCCAPTTNAMANLAAEGIIEPRAVLTGNTVVEAVQRLLPASETRKQELSDLGLQPDQYVLATIHRPENVDDVERLAVVIQQLGALSLRVVLTVHPRMAHQLERCGLTLPDTIVPLPPLPPAAFLGLAAEAALWVTDSGGLQEEASLLKRPVVVVRRSTERREAVGTFVTLVKPDGIGLASETWLHDQRGRSALAEQPTPFGDGRASARIVELISRLGFRPTQPAHA